MKRKKLPRLEQAEPPRSEALAFLTRFLIGLALGQIAITAFPGIEAWAIGITLDSLRFAVWCLHLPGGVQGASFHVGRSQVEIVGECTPLMPTLVMAAAISAYSAPRRAQLIGIAAGAAVLWVFNLARIGSLMAVLAWRPKSFDFVHMYLWQTLTLLVVLVIFLIWTRRQRTREEAP